MLAISVENLAVHYRHDPTPIKAVDGVSFGVEPGEVLVLLGPNGAGKTSTVETLEGYRHVTAGQVRVLGLDPLADHQELMAKVGIMLQHGGIHPGMRVIEALRLYQAFYEDPIAPEELIERLGLSQRCRSTWRHLSGGEQQRLSLALALIGKPKVLFLDEPTSGLDVTGRLIVREIIKALRDNGVAVLITTHELNEAERLADRIVIIDKGKVVATGSPAELMGAQTDQGVNFAVSGEVDLESLSSQVQATVLRVGDGEYRIERSPTPEMISALTTWLAERDLVLGDLRANRHSLEDVFLRLTSKTPPDEALP